MGIPVVILDTVTLRHFLVLGRVGLLQRWLGGGLCVPEAVHQELLRGVDAHDPQTLSLDPATAQVRSARFKAYATKRADLGVQVLPALPVDALSAEGVRLLVALERQKRPPVHAGEKEVILWALERCYRICTDDRGAYLTIRAIQQGQLPGLSAHPSLQVIGIPGLLAEQLRQGSLSETEAAALWAEVREVWRRAPPNELRDLLAGEYW